jgi:hypothetical protein
MIRNYEASLTMDRLMKNCKIIIRRIGTMYPIICLMNRGRPFPGGMKEDLAPGVLDVYTDPLTVVEHDVHRALIQVDLKQESDDSRVNEIAAYYASKYSPDAVGFIMSCLYKDIPKTEIEGVQLNRDPESVKALHGAYFLMGNTTQICSMVPHVNRGCLSEDKDEEPEYDVTFSDYPWAPLAERVLPLFKNPYPVKE